MTDQASESAALLDEELALAVRGLTRPTVVPSRRSTSRRPPSSRCSGERRGLPRRPRARGHRGAGGRRGRRGDEGDESLGAPHERRVVGPPRAVLRVAPRGGDRRCRRAARSDPGPGTRCCAGMTPPRWAGSSSGVGLRRASSSPRPDPARDERPVGGQSPCRTCGPGRRRRRAYIESDPGAGTRY